MVKKGPNMTYPKEASEKLKDANRKLRATNKRQKNEIIQLQKRLNQYEEAFARNFEHITEMMDGMTVEDAIRITKKSPSKAQPETKEIVRQKYREMFKNEKDK
jgi:uncharacterized protein YlxW (UPF0749 family)